MLSFIKKNNPVPLRYHLLFWVVYFFFNVIRWGSFFDDYGYSFKSNLVEFSLHLFSCYTTVFYLIPKFVLQKKYISFLIGLFLVLVIVYLGIVGLNYLFVTHEIWPEANGIRQPLTLYHFMAVAIGEIYVIAFVSAIKISIDWINEKRINDRLSKIQLQTELNFLKSQIQPHFYFNTLNSLYALTLEKSDLAPNLVLKLSDIMQYILYDVRTSGIRLLDEIKYIQHYIDLERFRFKEKVQADTHISGDIEDIIVPPLLFLPFIENCFKHGRNEDNQIVINIIFKILPNNRLQFQVSNKVRAKLPDTANKPEDEKGGIGIENVKRRLNLLYNDQYELLISKKNTKFKVRLTIPFKQTHGT